MSNFYDYIDAANGTIQFNVVDVLRAKSYYQTVGLFDINVWAVPVTPYDGAPKKFSWIVREHNFFVNGGIADSLDDAMAGALAST